MRAFLSLVMAAVMLPIPAYAVQESPKWTIADARPAHTRGDARLTANDFARLNMGTFSRCMLEKHREPVEAAMDVPPESGSYAALSKLVDASCLTGGGMISMPAEVMRSGLFVARYQRDFDKSMPPLPVAAAGLSARLPTDASRGRVAALRGIADCLWRADANDARLAIMSVPGSRDETKAYGGLEERLQSCSPDRPVHFSRAVLGGLLAEVAFLELASPVAVN